ncbi:MAG TPA: threonine/serine exporter family protein [Candidatus Scybalocola faecavium]|nr:threonine/serine exporter family protein [Candidatus Scybalocola faecavium]
MLLTLVIEFFVALLATDAFCVIFNVPKKEWFFSGLIGAVGWVFYRGFSQNQGIVIATFIAVMAVTLLARIFAVVRKAPVTIFLVPGIFPLVPGVGIYYTSYYFIISEFSMASAKGVETLKVAVAITLGIMCMLLIPQRFFQVLVSVGKRKLKK